VVSIGADIDEMLADPKKQEWRKISVEFCGGTHVEKTGLIKDLVIIEESGIAKGIRRIIAYTGDAAHQVQRDATEFSKRLDALASMDDGAAKEQEMKAVSVDLGQLTASTLTKDELKKRFEKISKEIIDLLKKRQKLESKTALDTVQNYFKADENAKWFVGKLPISANAKAITDVINQIKKDKERSVYLFGGSPEEGAVVHGVCVGSVSNSHACSSSRRSKLTVRIGSFREGHHCRAMGYGSFWCYWRQIRRQGTNPSREWHKPRGSRRRG
jgi:alanyl-tRNA synthetase